jgi:hypothetical protein
MDGAIVGFLVGAAAVWLVVYSAAIGFMIGLTIGRR